MKYLKFSSRKSKKTNQIKEQEEELNSADRTVKDTIKSLFKSNIDFLSSKIEGGKLNFSLFAKNKIF